MKLPLVGITLASLATASSDWQHSDHAWHPAGPFDSRSPCPGLNALANHGWLPRSGKNIDLDTFRSAISGAYNYEPTSMDFIFSLALKFNLTTTGNQSTFNLVDLARHDEIEFDGSLSRNDIYFGDDLHFDPTVWASTARRLQLYDTRGSVEDQYVTLEAAARARAARVADAKRANPSFNASANQMAGSPGTTALYLTTLWDDKVGAVPKSWIKAFFEDERIPYNEGYKAPQKQLTLADVTEMTNKVEQVTI